MRTQLRAVLVLMVLIAAGTLALALTVVPSPAQKEEVKAADRVARAYERALDQTLAELGAYVVERRLENQMDYEKLYDEVLARVESVPRIPKRDTTVYGREHSREYRTAGARRGLELQQYGGFLVFLRDHAIPRQKFVDAGVDLVQINPRKLLEGFIVQFSGAPLRTEVIPAYRKARKKLLRQEPAAEDAELARDLKTYADDTIKMIRNGADDIDAGRPFFFDFGDRPNALLTRLEDTVRSISAEVSARVDALETTGGALNDPSATPSNP